MDLYSAIKELYPNAVAPGDPEGREPDFQVRDDGAGPYISRWNEAKLGPRPTSAQLAEAWFRVAVKRKAADWDARQVKEGGKPYEDKLRAATGQDVPPHAIVWNLIMDIAETIRTTEQTTNLKNAVEMRKKRDRGLAVLATKTPGADPIAAASVVLTLRWEDLV